ncbi:MAG: YybH family protein [Paracoccaceae bacterium]
MAWDTGKFDQVGRLFTKSAVFHETPFDAPMRGREAIHRYWLEGASSAQAGVPFESDILFVVDDQCFSHGRATFTRVPSGVRVEIVGVFRLVFERGWTGRLLYSKLQARWHRR